MEKSIWIDLVLVICPKMEQTCIKHGVVFDLWTVLIAAACKHKAMVINVSWWYETEHSQGNTISMTWYTTMLCDICTVPFNDFQIKVIIN